MSAPVHEGPSERAPQTPVPPRCLCQSHATARHTTVHSRHTSLELSCSNHCNHLRPQAGLPQRRSRWHPSLHGLRGGCHRSSPARCHSFSWCPRPLSVRTGSHGWLCYGRHRRAARCHSPDTPAAQSLSARRRMRAEPAPNPGSPSRILPWALHLHLSGMQRRCSPGTVGPRVPPVPQT